ncbi:MAG: alpha/beta hydrolase [Pseudomonadota bacterium]|nr:alpha/beta hydrolase [Pseudomonadota bacterium]
MKPMRIAALTTGALIVAAGLAFGGLMVATSDEAPVRETVMTDESLPVLTVNGVKLHGEVVGPENAPLVIVLHGGPGGDHRSLRALENLADDYRVLMFDQRGAGLSERVSQDALTIDAYLDDIDALAARYAPDDEIILIGHSFGAMLAVGYMGYRPERVARAVLIEPGFLDEAGYAAWEDKRQTIAGSGSVTMTGLLAGFRARNVTSADDAAQRDYIVGEVVHAFADHPDNPYHCAGESYAAPSWRFGGLASDTFWANPEPLFPLMEAGTGVRTPVMFMAGGCNDWTGEALQADHAARFTNAETVTIPGAGHDVVWDQGDAALDAIRAFVGAR